jgi:hypothetical protein
MVKKVARIPGSEFSQSGCSIGSSNAYFYLEMASLRCFAAGFRGAQIGWRGIELSTEYANARSPV